MLILIHLFYIQFIVLFNCDLMLLVWHQEEHLICKKIFLVQIKITGCWFVGGDDLTGALHVLQLSSSCHYHLHHP